MTYERIELEQIQEILDGMSSPSDEELVQALRGFSDTAIAFAAAKRGLDVVSEFNYTQITSNVSITATSASTPDTVLTAPAVTYDGSTVVLIEFFCAQVSVATGNGSLLRIGLWDGATDLGRIASFTNPTGVTAQGVPVRTALRVTPTAGAHTYKVVSWMSAGATGTIIAGIGGPAGVIVPAFLRQSRAA